MEIAECSLAGHRRHHGFLIGIPTLRTITSREIVCAERLRVGRHFSALPGPKHVILTMHDVIFPLCLPL